MMGLTEDNTAKNVTNGAVWRAPHFLQAEFFNTLFVRRNRRAFNTGAVFLDRFSGINCDLIISIITGFNAEIVIFQINIEIRVNQLVFDELPDDPCHLISIQLNKWIFDLNFCHSRNFLFNFRASVFKPRLG